VFLKLFFGFYQGTLYPILFQKHSPNPSTIKNFQQKLKLKEIEIKISNGQLTQGNNFYCFVSSSVLSIKCQNYIVRFFQNYQGIQGESQRNLKILWNPV
jgi:hypothetical protein